MHAFILAGGFATRLWPLTDTRAKPLLPLAGKALLSHITDAIPADIPVTVSTNALFAEAFKAWAATCGRKNVHVIIERTRSDDEKLGALGAVAQWIETEKISDDILLLTGDNYFGFSLQAFLDRYQAGTPLLAAFNIQERAKASSFGTVILAGDEQSIAAFEEKPKEPKTTLVSTGCSVLPASVLPILLTYAKAHPDNVGGIFEELLRQGKTVQCFTFSEPWFDVGSFEAYLDATRTLVGDRIVVPEGSTIENTKTEGSVVIGKGCVVRDCVLRDTVVFDGCTLTDCVLEDCIIDDACNLTHVDLRGKMIRAKTVLEQHPH